MFRYLALALVVALPIGCAQIGRSTYDAFLYSESAMICLQTARRVGAREAKRKGHHQPNDEIARAQSRCRTEVPRDQWRVIVLSRPDDDHQFEVDTWPEGLSVRARPKDAEWVEVTFPDGRRGWVPFSQLILIYEFSQQAAA
jgi:hypothetical protein